MKVSLKNIDENITTEFNTTAIKQKNKYKFLSNDEMYILNIISPQKIVLNRESKEIKHTMYFEINKKISSIYTLKQNNITLDIDILTQKLEINDESVKIIYTIVDSNMVYEYNIEMSE